MSVPQLPFLFRVYEAAFNMKYVGQIDPQNIIIMIEILYTFKNNIWLIKNRNESKWPITHYNNTYKNHSNKTVEVLNIFFYMPHV